MTMQVQMQKKLQAGLQSMTAETIVLKCAHGVNTLPMSIRGLMQDIAGARQVNQGRRHHQSRVLLLGSYVVS